MEIHRHGPDLAAPDSSSLTTAAGDSPAQVWEFAQPDVGLFSMNTVGQIQVNDNRLGVGRRFEVTLSWIERKTS